MVSEDLTRELSVSAARSTHSERLAWRRYDIVTIGEKKKEDNKVGEESDQMVGVSREQVEMARPIEVQLNDRSSC